MTNKPFKAALLAVATSAALVACGGGGGDDNSYDTASAIVPPATASANAQGFLDFVTSLNALMLDSRAEYDVSALTLPTDSADTLEPAPTSIDQ